MNEAINQLYTGQKRLASRRTWIYLLVRLVRHCVSVQWLAITLVEIQFARKSTQGFHSLATKPKPTRVEWHPYIPCYSFTATYKALKYIPVFFLLRLACTFDETSKFVWSYNASLCISSICGYLRLLAATCESVFSLTSTEPNLWRQLAVTTNRHVTWQSCCRKLLAQLSIVGRRILPNITYYQHTYLLLWDLRVMRWP